MKAFLAVVRFFTSHHLRSPLILLAVLLHSLLCSGLPRVGLPGSVFQERQILGASLGVGQLVLLVVALVLPLVSLPWSARSRLGAARSPLFLQGAALLGHGLFLLALACVLSGATLLMSLLLPPGGREGGRPPLVRTSLGNPGSFELGPTSPQKLISFPLGPRLAPGNRLLLRLHPHVRLERGGPQHLSLRFPLQLALKLDGQRTWKRLRPLAFTGSQPLFRWVQLRKEPLPARALLRLKVARPGYSLLFQEQGLLILGQATSATASLFSAFFMQGLAALSLMAVCLWFSRIVSYPIAAAAALTLVLLALAVGRGILPGLPPQDPARLLSMGRGLSLADGLAALLQALGWSAMAVLLPARSAHLEPPL